ncbi:hypothetical protein F5X68DRAFT_264214 [Plectosphaerella plurivora]|uniref:Uncharacterized protein n=1 Tax=Plectosphaerella plurivora TaxID=936078 RepID=A0A9P9A7Q4_9PEZI|nr:hypothetical protein F5X68DRAFT_264214 [Plectosphaerella plurivora]
MPRPEIKLPLEIWRMVAESLCMSCSRDEPTTPDDRWAFDENSYALSDLCRVALLLLRTLLDRPDLARHVRELHHEQVSGWPHLMKQIKVGNTMHGVPDCDDPRATLLLFDRLRQFQPPGMVHGDKGWDTMPSCPEWEFAEPHQRTVSLMSLLPNLDNATVQLRWGWPCTGHLRLSRGYLPHLKTASITCSNTQSASLDRQLRSLAEAAPNLASLNLFSINFTPGEWQVDDPVFPNVTHLFIDHTFLDACVVAFVNAFPRLESLALHAEVAFWPQEHYDLPVLIAESKPCRRLKSLSLDNFEYLCATESGIAPGEPLASMENLEVLKVDQACIGITDQPDKPVFLTKTKNQVPPLTRINFDLLQPGYVQSFNVKSLPTSLRALHIFCYYWADPENLWQAVLNLALTAPQRLPNLKVIVLEFFREFERTFVLNDDLTTTWENAAVWDEVGIKLVCTKQPPFMTV